MSLKSPQLPLTIPCVDCIYPQLTLTLNKIDIDTDARLTRWGFSFLNDGRILCTPRFYKVEITDPNGRNYSGQGQVSYGKTFALSIKQSVQENALFDVLPTSGTQYTLTMILDGSYGGYYGQNTYATQNFTFA